MDESTLVGKPLLADLGEVWGSAHQSVDRSESIAEVEEIHVAVNSWLAKPAEFFRPAPEHHDVEPDRLKPCEDGAEKPKAHRR